MNNPRRPISKKYSSLIRTGAISILVCSVSLIGIGTQLAYADGAATPEEVQRDCMQALTPDDSIRVSVDDKTKCIQAIEKAMAAKSGKKSAVSEQPVTHVRTVPFISTINLKPKTMEFGIGINYSHNIAENRSRTDRSRDMSMPVSLSLGHTDRLQSVFSISFQNNTNEIASAGKVDTYKESGSGDSTIGLVYRLTDSRSWLPSTSLSMTYGIPTGKPSDPKITGSTGTGTGYKYGALGLSIVKDSDPAVIFGSFGYRHVFERKQEELTVQPGATFSYGFGAGFSINNSLTLSGSVGGSIQSETKYDGEEYAGTRREPIAFRTGLTYHTSRAKRFEANLDYGLNDDASAVSFDLMYLINF